jgi:hypothetical protein
MELGRLEGGVEGHNERKLGLKGVGRYKSNEGFGAAVSGLVRDLLFVYSCGILSAL